MLVSDGNLTANRAKFILLANSTKDINVRGLQCRSQFVSSVIMMNLDLQSCVKV